MRTKRLFIIVFLVLTFCTVRNTHAQPGSLDNTFGTGGIVTTDFGGDNDYCRSVVIQSDGKILVAGGGVIGFILDFTLARYNSDGTLDTTFGTGGKVITDFAGLGDAGWSATIQSDGKILVAGESSNGFNYDFALVRYNTDGTLDNTFGSGGKVTTPIGSSDDWGYSAAIQTDGKIVVAGVSSNGADLDFALARYNSDGTLDNIFGTGGKVTTPVGSADDYGWSAAIQSDGKILVAGYYYNGVNNDFALVRYNPDGTMDNTFGTGGKVTTDFGSPYDEGRSVCLQTDGKIVVAGYYYNGADVDFALVRYNSDGTLDNTFGTGGKVTTGLGIDEDYGYSAVIQSDGKIIVAGHSYNSASFADFSLARYNSDGSLDGSFGSGGKVTTATGPSYDWGRSVAIQSDGKIVVAGLSGGVVSNFLVVRYNGGASGITEEINDGSFHVSIFPNPFTSSATLSINSPLIKGDKGGCQFTMYDLLGREMKSETIRNSDPFVIRRDNLPSGMYLYKLTDGVKILATGKVVIQ